MSLLFSLAGNGGYIGCHVYHSAAQSLTSGIETVLAFNSERVDASPDGLMHDLVTNNSRVVIRTPGMYNVSACIAFDSNSAGTRIVKIRLNGATVIGMANIPAAPAGAESVVPCTAPAFLFAANDYIEVLANQTSGGALNVAASSAYSPNFCAVKC